MVLKMPQITKDKQPKRTAEDFIQEGGAEPENKKKVHQDTFKMSFRCPPELMEKVDAWRSKRPGHISRNQAVIEILDRFMKKQGG